MAADDASPGTPASLFQHVIESAEAVARVLSASIAALKEADASIRRDFPATPDLDRMVAAIPGSPEERELVITEVLGSHALALAIAVAEWALKNATDIAASARAARFAEVAPDAARELGSADTAAGQLATDCDGYQRFIATVKSHLYKAEGGHQRRSAESGAESGNFGSPLRLRSLLALEEAYSLGQGLPEAVARVTEAVSAAKSAVEEAQAT